MFGKNLKRIIGGTGLFVVMSGCLTRPVSTQQPTTKTNFSTARKRQAVDKIDILLAIDNSASMGDKQKILADAVPELVTKLVQPACLDANGAPNGTNPDPKTGKCANGAAEFEPVGDVHIGVISSSLGGFGDAQDCGGKNDRANLIVRDTSVEAEESKFLAWFPDTDKNASRTDKPAKPYKDVATLKPALTKVVAGVGEDGCGLEAQMESVYQFLIAPDPWERILVTNNRATYDGFNNAILKQRHDFLRPDSLVAVIMLTDEPDSSVDPLAIGGQGWAYMSTDFPGGNARPSELGGGRTAPRGTSICARDPKNEKCRPCAFGKDPSDPNCSADNGFFKPEEDQMNVRFHRMKQRYGVDPQYPILRYINGFRSTAVPSRAGEHDAAGNYVIQQATTDLVCTNPLFAAKLPESSDPNAKADWCKMGRGERDPSLVFFAVVGGVPNELLHFDPANLDNSRLEGKDWVKILGTDPVTYDYTGIDPRMIESTKVRDSAVIAENKGDGAARPGPGSADATDPDELNTSHRDWTTGDGDLQYACTFKLETPKPAKPSDPNYDCKANSDAPLCAAGAATAARDQVRAKAFPTIRELAVVRALGEQGIASSLCPLTLDKAQVAKYGYNPAVALIVDRLKNALTQQCLPRPLTPDANGEVACLMLEILPPDETRACTAIEGRAEPNAQILAKFKDDLRAEQGKDVKPEDDKTKRKICTVGQIPFASGQSCSNGGKSGWCYTEKVAGSKCTQAVVFADGKDPVPLPKAELRLQCINQSEATSKPAP